MSEPLSRRRGAPRARNLEFTLTWLVLGGGLPAVALAVYYLFRQDHTPEVRWTLLVVVLLVWLAAASAAPQLAIRSL